MKTKYRNKDKDKAPNIFNIQLTSDYWEKVNTFKQQDNLSTRTDAVRKLIDLGIEWYNMQKSAIKKVFPEITV